MAEWRRTYSRAFRCSILRRTKYIKYTIHSHTIEKKPNRNIHTQHYELFVLLSTFIRISEQCAGKKENTEYRFRHVVVQFIKPCTSSELTNRPFRNTIYSNANQQHTHTHTESSCTYYVDYTHCTCTKNLYYQMNKKHTHTNILNCYNPISTTYMIFSSQSHYYNYTCY